MIGPVFALEITRAARGRLFHIGRWAYGSWLAILLFFTVMPFANNTGTDMATRPAGDFARVSHGLIDWLIIQQTLALLLAAPSFAAGAVTDEKVQGTLEPLFLAHLLPGEIVLGKLAARVAEGFLWGMASWPILAFLGTPGGVTPMFFVALAAITLLMLLGVCSISMLASVWSRTTRDAVLSIYFVLIAMIFVVKWAQATAAKTWWGYSLAALDPLYILDAARDQPDIPEMLKRLRASGFAWLGLSLVAISIAVWRLRPAFIKQQHVKSRKPWFAFLHWRPEVAEVRPLAWKEQHVTRGMPRWMALALAALLTASLVGSLGLFVGNRFALQEAFLNAHWTMLVLVGLAVGVRASGSITIERERKTWDSLLLTPLTLEAIIEQKLLGIRRAVWPYYFVFVVVGSLAVAWLCSAQTIDAAILLGVLTTIFAAGTYIAYRQAGVAALPIGVAAGVTAVCHNLEIIVPLGLLGSVMVHVLMVFMGGVGVWFSARSNSTWVALLGTVLVGLLGAAALIVVSLPIMCLSCFFMYFAFALIQAALQSGVSSSPGFFMFVVMVGSSFAFYAAGRYFAAQACTYLGRVNRISEDFVHER